MTQPNPPRHAPTERCTVPMAAPRFATAPHPAGPAPEPAASLRRRIDGRRAAAPRPSRGRVRGVLSLALSGGALADGVAVKAGTSPTGSAVVLLVVMVAVLALGALWLFRARWGLDAPTRELRRRASAETRTVRALEPLESAGWVLLHDRLVANERVPHILVGPPGAVVLHPHSFGRAAPLRALTRRIPRLGRRPAPAPVEPAELGDPVALRTRDTLLRVLTQDPDLADWFLVAYAMIPVLDRPADRAVLNATPVEHPAVGPLLRRTLETELPAGLTRTAAAYLASITDHACPPHDPHPQTRPRRRRPPRRGRTRRVRSTTTATTPTGTPTGTAAASAVAAGTSTLLANPRTPHRAHHGPTRGEWDAAGGGPRPRHRPAVSHRRVRPCPPRGERNPARHHLHPRGHRPPRHPSHHRHHHLPPRRLHQHRATPAVGDQHREAGLDHRLRRTRPCRLLRVRPPGVPRARRLPQQPPQPVAATRGQPQPQRQA